MARPVLGAFGRRGFALGALGLSLASGCGSPDHPGYVGEGGPPGASAGKGGKSHEDLPEGGTGETSAGGAGPNHEEPLGGAASELGQPSADLEPTAVYTMGQLAHTFAQGVVRADAPDTYLFGISYEASNRGALLLGKALLYPTGGVLRRFVPDAEISGQAIDVDYPSEPTANDPIVDTPACSGEALMNYGFLASPSGRLIYFCNDERQWYEGDEAVYGDMPYLAALHDNGFALANLGGVEFGSRAIVNIDEPIAQRPVAISGDTKAVRSHGEGFRVVVRDRTDPGTFRLWQVAFDGSAENIGEYPAAPDIVSCERIGNFDSRQSALDPDDALYQWCGVRSEARFALIRRTLAGESEVLYNDPQPYITGTALITGP